jgi:hypothetical protein
MLLTACNAADDSIAEENGSYQPNIQGDVAQQPTPTPVPTLEPINMQPNQADSTAICLIRAAEYIAMMDVWFDKDGGALWGTYLHAPFMFADPVTRKAVANMPDESGHLIRHETGIYTAILPSSIHIGSTASYAYDKLWGMMTWSLVETLGDPVRIVRVMVHELFHAWQQELFVGERTQWTYDDLTHMDGADGRISVMLEINALLKALRSEGDERQGAVIDALSIRNERRLRNPGTAHAENAMEIHEGTAIYTDMRLAYSDMSEIVFLLEDYVEEEILGQNMRLFGYATGALYGFLLDEYEVDWRSGLRWDADLGSLLKDAAEVTAFKQMADMDLNQYDYAGITEFETLWVANNEIRLQEAQSIFAGPVMYLAIGGDFMDFIDVTVLYIRDVGVAYHGSFTYAGAFGRLEVTNGFLLIFRYHRVHHTTTQEHTHEIAVYELEIDGNRVIGSGWVLTLDDMYEVMRIGINNYQIRMRSR